MPLINIKDEVDKFFDASSKVLDSPPNFVLLTGGTGSGKTTIRRKEFKIGYVNIDVADIYVSVGKGEVFDVEGQTEKDLEKIGSLIAERAIAERRNVVTEIIGASEHEVKSIIDAVLSVGYKVSCNYVDCEPVEAYKRHVNAVHTDKTYMSAYYCEPLHKKWILEAVENNKK